MDNKKFIIALIFLVLAAVGGWVARDQLFGQSGAVTIIGEGKVYAQPQLAQLTVSWYGQAKNANDALRNEKAVLNSLMGLLANYGVGKQDVQIAYARVAPPASKDGDYQAINAMDVTLHTIDKLDQVIGALYSNGALSVSNIVFSADNPTALEEQAVAKAITDAEAKAKKTAQASGKKLGRLLSLTTSATGDVSSVTSQASSQLSGQTGATPGQIEVLRQVSVVYELK